MSAAAAAGGGFPKWMLLEPYVFRRDDADSSFPDDAEAPIMASGTTSWGANFRIAFSLAEPPKISRIYAHMPGFPNPREDEPLHVVAAHRRLALLDVTVATPSSSQGLGHNLFVLRVDEKNPAGSSSLTTLPPCTEPEYEDPRRRRPSDATPRLLDSMRSGLWCSGDKEEEFVVAELSLYVRTQGRRRMEARADICLLRSSFADDDQLGRSKWDTMRVPILFLRPTTDYDLWKLDDCWHTHAVIPFQRWLCWVGYHQGILFCDVSKEVPAPTVSFLWFPPDKYSLASTLKTPCSGNGGVSVVDNGRTLKFAYVARHDSGSAYGPLKPGTGFTITCHTLVLGDDDGSSMAWKEDYAVTSDELPEYLQRGGIPLYPQVDIVRPQVVHFLFCEFGKAYAKMSVLSIDMSTKTVESFYLYMDGNDPFQTHSDPYFIDAKCLSPTPMPFLSCEFPRFSNASRKRKDTG